MADGILNILKPPGMTSHDVVSFVRRTFGMKKVGHTGTLDPGAAGVLPVCLGKATRVAEYFNDPEVTKSYRGELSLGARTDTQDSYGEVVEEREFSNFTEEDLRRVVQDFTGKIEQIPPMYSAKKQDGKKLYQLARAGIEVERKSREIEIYSLELVKNKDNREILFDVECSSGTYVRTLCEDMACELGNLGHMSFLLRTRVGAYSIEDAYTLEEIENTVSRGEASSILLSLETALSHYSVLELDGAYFEKILNGVKIRVEGEYEPSKRYKVYCKGAFIGVGHVERETGNLKMEKVLFQR
ncbi:tRNA pseudouridine synthase B [Andreesenia angusta]|uniref:tRNA pseudouridine synthase B n=1 Tax=Andreesenia angusta TaxID=39480 RepID=A0A1S1V890_9FIRM|nr:tRNA pseudouridine(55) synthase TruB [Andreesenia angusta]OHW62806.1 tRNA pseudouridine synthase B [Andreesenia angusta]